MKRTIAPFIAITALVVLALACGSQSVTPSVVSTAPITVTVPDAVVISSFTPAPPTPIPTPTLVKLTTYNIGDIIQMSDYTIVLNSAEIDNNILKANFTIENQGNEPVNLSDWLDFDVKDGEGTKMEQTFVDCGAGLGGAVLPGDKSKGDVCWSLTEAKAMPFKIYYQENFWDATSTVVWIFMP